MSSARQRDDSDRPTCLFCSDWIHAEEPLIVVEHEGERETSLAREPELGRRSVLMVHSRCAPGGWRRNQAE